MQHLALTNRQPLDVTAFTTQNKPAEGLRFSGELAETIARFDDIELDCCEQRDDLR